jgi:predicted naringenin-chalcone synthase
VWSTTVPVGTVYRRSGIDRRHSCLADYGRAPEAFEFFPRGWAGEPPRLPSTAERMVVYRRAARELGLEAARAALGRLPSLDPAQITHLIVASCTGFHAPGLDVDLVEGLGLSRQVARTLIGFQGCHAGLASLRLADAICRADPQSLVLVVCVELCTLHFQLGATEDNLLANSLFADGAGAVLLGADRGPEDGAGGPRLVISRGASWLEPGTGGEMAWTVGDHGFEMRLSALVPRLLGRQVERFLEGELGLDRAARRGLRFWAVHHGGPAILDEIERALGLDPALLGPSRAVLRDHGNMSSPTVLFVLERIRAALAGSEGGDAPGCGVALAFGPGLTLEALLLEARR